MWSALLLTLSAQSATLGEDARGQIVDMVVARVEDEVITLSELVAETGWVLVQTRGPEVALEGGLPRPLLRTVLEAMVRSELLLQEVERLQLDDVTEAEVIAEFEAFSRRFDSEAQLEAFYAAFGFELEPQSPVPSLLGRLISSQLRVERFIDVRLGLAAAPSAESVRRCLRLHAERFEGASAAESARAVTARIQEQLQGRALQRLVDGLEEEASIRYTPGFSPLRAEAPGPEVFSCPLSEL